MIIICTYKYNMKKKTDWLRREAGLEWRSRIFSLLRDLYHMTTETLLISYIHHYENEVSRYSMKRGKLLILMLQGSNQQMSMPTRKPPLWHITYSNVIFLHSYNICKDDKFTIFWKWNKVDWLLYFY